MPFGLPYDTNVRLLHEVIPFVSEWQQEVQNETLFGVIYNNALLGSRQRSPLGMTHNKWSISICILYLYKWLGYVGMADVILNNMFLQNVGCGKGTCSLVWSTARICTGVMSSNPTGSMTDLCTVVNTLINCIISDYFYIFFNVAHFGLCITRLWYDRQ